MATVPGSPKNNFTMSALTIDRLVECSFYAYYRVKLFHDFSFNIYMVKSGENICSEVFLWIFSTFVKMNVHHLSKLLNENQNLSSVFYQRPNQFL